MLKALSKFFGLTPEAPTGPTISIASASNAGTVVAFDAKLPTPQLERLAKRTSVSRRVLQVCAHTEIRHLVIPDSAVPGFIRGERVFGEMYIPHHGRGMSWPVVATLIPDPSCGQVSALLAA